MRSFRIKRTPIDSDKSPTVNPLSQSYAAVSVEQPCLIEGINSLVQAAKAKARGYRNSKTLKAVTYLIAGKLDLRLPT